MYKHLCSCLIASLVAAWIAPFVVLNTDYSSFACIYSCTGHSFGVGDSSYYSDFAFIFQRSPYQDPNAINACIAEFERIGVSASRFQYTPQGEQQCNYAAQMRL